MSNKAWNGFVAAVCGLLFLGGAALITCGVFALQGGHVGLGAAFFYFGGTVLFLIMYAPFEGPRK